MSENSQIQSNSAQLSLHPGGLRKLLGVSLLLCFSTFLARNLTNRYLDTLVHKGKMSQWTQAIHYLDTASAVFVIFQMLFLVFAYQVGDTKIDLKSLIRLLNPTPRKLLFIGFISGIAVYLLGLPIMLRLDDDIQFVALMADNPFSLRSVGVLVLLIGVVPIATEIGFRGVIFQAMENTTNIGTAVVGSALLFTYIWSVFNFVTALLLGLTTALLYHRYRQLTPGITASVTVTALGIFTLLLKILYGG